MIQKDDGRVKVYIATDTPVTKDIFHSWDTDGKQVGKCQDRTVKSLLLLKYFVAHNKCITELGIEKIIDNTFRVMATNTTK